MCEMKNILVRLMAIVVLASMLTPYGTLPVQANVWSNASLAFDCASVTEVPQTECEALVALYNGAGGPNWRTQTNWLVTLTPSNWYGVSVSGSHVISLNLYDNQLAGTIPVEIGGLTSLQTLNLSYNQLTGSIPAEVGSLSSLQDLQLWSNQLNGSIPTGLGDLSNLSVLNLSGNSLSGGIPPELGGLSNLQFLALSGNYLGGNIPNALSNLHNLQELYLAADSLTGSIPAFLGNLGNLQVLVLRANQLTGSIPPELGNLAGLKDIYLDSNQLSGNLPPELGRLSSLQRLDFSFNNLSGSLPSEYSAMVNLREADFGFNQLSGSLPDELGSLSNLQWFTIRDNPLDGAIPFNFINLTKVYVFDYQNTSLCEPTNPAIQAWLQGILNLRGTGIPCGGADFVITAIELTQAIQDFEHSVPLIENKVTYARLHVRNSGSPYGGPGTAKLCNGSDCRLPDNPNKNIIVRSNPDPDRRVLEESFYIQLPPGWLQGSLDLVATVNPPGTGQVYETNLDNNTWSQSFSFVPSVPLKIKIFGVTYVTLIPPKAYAPEQADYDLVKSWLNRAYPVAEIQYSQDLVDMVVPPQDYDLILPLYAFKVNHQLYAYWLWDTQFGGVSQDTRYYGLVPNDPYTIVGAAFSIPGNVATGPAGQGGDTYAGEELGHTYGRRHPGYCMNQIRDSEHPDGDYPDGKISPADGSMVGFDTSTLEIYAPEAWYDVMTYCSNRWISGFTYQGLYDYLTSTEIKTEATTTTGEHVIVSGMLNYSQNTATLETAYRIPDITAPIPPLTGTHTIKLFGEGGILLAEYPFTPAVSSNNSPGYDEIGTFGETVPWVDGTQEIGIYSATLELDSQSVSLSSPNVSLTSPVGGESFVESIPVTWQASDSDGDPLTYVIQYSADNGVTWQVTTYAITNTTSYTIPAGLLAGSDTGKIRIVASDGVNTGIDETDGVFSLAAKPPVAHITSPVSGASYLPGQTIILVGAGDDVEDGNLPDAALSWRSDVSGDLGTGKMLDATGLTPGNHIITLTVTDSNGDATTTTIRLYIGYISYLPIAATKE